MMFKNKEWFLCLALISEPALASQMTFSGIYTMLAVGAVQNEADQNASIKDTFKVRDLDLNIFEWSDNATLTQSSFSGGINMGYGRNFQPFYLGGQIGLMFNQWDIEHDTRLSHQEIKENYIYEIQNAVQSKASSSEFIAALKPGVILNQSTLLYGLVGGSYTRFTLKQNQTLQVRDLPSGGIVESTLALNSSKQMSGVNLGVGIEQSLSECVSLGLLYLNTRYDKQNVMGLANSRGLTSGGASAMTPDGLSGSGAVTPVRHGIYVTLTYYPKFASRVP